MSIWLNETEKYEAPKTEEELKLEIQQLKIEYIALDDNVSDEEIEDELNVKTIDLRERQTIIAQKEKELWTMLQKSGAARLGLKTLDEWNKERRKWWAENKPIKEETVKNINLDLDFPLKTGILCPRCSNGELIDFDGSYNYFAMKEPCVPTREDIRCEKCNFVSRAAI